MNERARVLVKLMLISLSIRKFYSKCNVQVQVKIKHFKTVFQIQMFKFKLRRRLKKLKPTPELRLL
jgi:hypothetical protein